MSSTPTGEGSARTFVVVGGGNGSGNHGDEVMWEATIDALRRIEPGAPVITDGTPGWVSEDHLVEVLPSIHQSVRRLTRVPRNRVETAAQLAVNRGGLERGLRRCRELQGGMGPRPGVEATWGQAVSRSHAVVVAGAGALTDAHALHAVVGWGMLAALARHVDVPMAFLGQGVGPLEAPQLRESLARTMDGLSLFTTRDEVSAQVARSINPSCPVRAAPDWAIPATPTEAHRSSAEEVVAHHVGGQGFVAISLRRHPRVDGERGAALTRLVARIVGLAADRGAQVLMVPSCVGLRGSDDRVHMSEVRDALDPSLADRCRVMIENVPAQTVRAVIGRSWGLFSTRYHPVVFALAEGVPATGLALDPYYQQKLAGALSWYREGHRVLDPDSEISDASLVAGIDPERETLRARRARTEGLREACEQPFLSWLEGLS